MLLSMYFHGQLACEAFSVQNSMQKLCKSFVFKLFGLIGWWVGWWVGSFFGQPVSQLVVYVVCTNLFV